MKPTYYSSAGIKDKESKFVGSNCSIHISIKVPRDLNKLLDTTSFLHSPSSESFSTYFPFQPRAVHYMLPSF